MSIEEEVKPFDMLRANGEGYVALPFSRSSGQRLRHCAIFVEQGFGVAIGLRHAFEDQGAGGLPGEAFRMAAHRPVERIARSEEHTSELQSLMRISYAVFCLKKKKTNRLRIHTTSFILTMYI